MFNFLQRYNYTCKYVSNSITSFDFVSSKVIMNTAEKYNFKSKKSQRPYKKAIYTNIPKSCFVSSRKAASECLKVQILTLTVF